MGPDLIPGWGTKILQAVWPKKPQKPKKKKKMLKEVKKIMGKKLNKTRDFPGGPVVKNLPSNAGDVGSIPGRGTKIPHAVGQLSSHTTPEPASLN